MRSKDKITHPDFVYYLIASHQVKPYAIAQMTGSSGRQRVPTSKFKTIRVKLPPIAQQEAISTSLGVLDDKIELNNDINTTLENMAEAIFKSWFVDFDPVHAKQLAREASLPVDRAAMAVIAALCSPSEFVENFATMDEVLTQKLASMSSTERDTLTHTASLFPDRFEESEMGAIPRGWGVGKLGEIILLKNGKKPPDNNSIGCIPVFGANGVIGYGNTSNSSESSIIIGRVGSCGSIHFWEGACWISDNAILAKAKIKNSINYCYFLLLNLDLNSFKSGSVQPLLTQRILNELNIVVPNKKIIEIFDEFICPMIKFIHASGQESKNLAHLRDTILLKLINGDIDVSALLE